MGFLDIILGSLLAFGLYKGIKNGLFVELASLASLLVGIYLATKFSSIVSGILSSFVSWNPNTIQVIAFMLTFVGVVIGIFMMGKFLTGIANFAYLGWINKLGGGFFRVLKTILIVSVVLTVFEKINYHNFLVKKETINNSLFYNPIQKTAVFIFPSIEKWYDAVKKKQTFTTPQTRR
jgi:membrane protein required for colicin V production